MSPDESPEGRLSTDRDTIRTWAEEYDVVPVRTTATEADTGDVPPYEFREESRRTESAETVGWDEFSRAVDENDLVVAFHGEGADRPLEVVDRDRATSTADMEADELEERLLAGDTVESEITETTVVEKTMVEHATVESEIVDTEVLDSRIVDAELRSREIGDCEVVDRDALDDVDHSRFADVEGLAGRGSEDLPRGIAVEVDVEEDWTVTRELLERATIESQISDVDVSETEEVEADSVRSSIEVEGIQRALLGSDVVETQADPDAVIESGTIESEFHEDDVVRTVLTEHRTVEDELTERRVLRGELTESESLEAWTTNSTTVESGFVEGERLDDDVTPIGTTGTGAAAREEIGSGETVGAAGGTATAGDEHTSFTEEDEGKPVVGADGETVGMVEEVREGTAYVDPDPGLVDRIKSRLGWGSADEEEDYTLEAGNVERITDDEVELSVPR